MKKIYFFVLVTALMSCDQPAVNNQLTDDRPASEINLIKKFAVADSLFQAQANEIRKSEISDSLRNQISNFIINDLKFKAQNWIAKVYKINVNDISDNYITVDLMVPIKNNEDEKYPEYSSIILTSNVNSNSTKLKNILKNLKSKDSVLISGRFEKSPTGNIFFISYSTLDLKFSNPQFDFDLTDIKILK